LGNDKKPVNKAGGTKNMSKKPTFFVRAKNDRYSKNDAIPA
jgi:hypothetical protein